MFFLFFFRQHEFLLLPAIKIDPVRQHILSVKLSLIHLSDDQIQFFPGGRHTDRQNDHFMDTAWHYIKVFAQIFPDTLQTGRIEYGCCAKIPAAVCQDMDILFALRLGAPRLMRARCFGAGLS